MLNSPRPWLPLVLALALCGNVMAVGLDTQPAAVREITLEQRFDGVVEAVHRATVSAQTSGRIEAILFDVDDYVERGAVLLRFRATEQAARQRQAEAGLEEARARLREARDERGRIAGIFARGLVAKAAMDRADADLKAAQARFESAQAQLAEASEQLEHTVVRAPYSGIVVERHVELGETANPGQPLMTGLSLERLRAVTAVPQRYVTEVRALAPDAIRVYTDAGAALSSESITVSPYADPGSHSFRVRLDLAPGSHSLYPGMLVKVGFALGEGEQLLIPQSALVRRSEVTGVYVVDPDGAVTLRQIRAGHIIDDDHVVVLAGLKPGEQVALDPVAAAVLLKRQTAGTTP